MSNEPEKPRQVQFSLLAVLWIVTLAAVWCGALLAELKQQTLLAMVLLVLGGTVWFCGAMVKIEQEIQRQGNHPPFFQRLMTLIRGWVRPRNSQD